LNEGCIKIRFHVRWEQGEQANSQFDLGLNSDISQLPQRESSSIGADIVTIATVIPSTTFNGRTAPKLPIKRPFDGEYSDNVVKLPRVKTKITVPIFQLGATDSIRKAFVAVNLSRDQQ
jgi:hypothetical protein